MDAFSLDTRTLNFIIILFSFIYAASFMLFQKSQRRVAGLTMFAISILGIGLGPMLLGMRGIITDWISTIGGNLFALLAFLLNLYSLCVFRRYNKKIVFAVATGLPLITMLLVYFTTLYPSPRARVMLVSFYLSVTCLTTAYVVYKGKREDFRLAVNMMAGSFALYGLFMLYRVVYTFFSTETVHFTSTGVVHKLGFLFSIILVVSLSFSMFWLLNARLVQSIHELSYFDPLTKLRNRRALELHVKKRSTGRSRRLKPMSIIMLDIDHFKVINDDYGHIMGDKVLMNVSEVILSQLNSSGTAFRYGGDEVMIVIDDADLSRARELAECIRGQIAAIFEQDIDDLDVTCSFGVAESTKFEMWDSLVSRADKALYQAKEQGRNRVCDGHLALCQPIAV